MVRQARVRRGVVVAQGDQTVSGVPGRYATALFELAQEAKSVDQVGADLASFQALLDESNDLKRLVRSPVFSAEDQISALEALCAKAGITSFALNFIKLTAQNRRLFVLADMIKAYQTLVAQAKGEISAEVISADKLSPKHLADLKAAIKASVGRDVQLSTRVDSAILGGLVVKVGSRMVDNSLKTKLQNLKIAMKGIG
jgi:F-type H+-transporting ATPase subunit delta